MFKSLKRLLNVLQHREVYLSLFVVPIKGDSSVFSSGSVFFDSVFACLDYNNEMVCIFFACVLDFKIICNQSEFNQVCLVLLQSWYQFALVVPKFSEAFFK